MRAFTVRAELHLMNVAGIARAKTLSLARLSIPQDSDGLPALT